LTKSWGIAPPKIFRFSQNRDINQIWMAISPNHGGEKTVDHKEKGDNTI
jgi:hypothetical protein